MKNNPSTSKKSSRTLSLAPLTFREAVSDLLKIKPEPKNKPKVKQRLRKPARSK